MGCADLTLLNQSLSIVSVVGGRVSEMGQARWPERSYDFWNGDEESQRGVDLRHRKQFRLELLPTHSRICR